VPAAPVTAHAPPRSRAPTGRAWRLDAVVLALGTLALRVPALLASRHLSFDDGVYGASAVAMRHGAAPFRDVFSSQGPLFLPLVYVFDLVGLRTLDGPRLLSLASAVAIALGVYAAGRELTDRGGALLAAALTAASGSVLFTTGPITSDGPGSAFAVVAVAVALGSRRAPATRRALVIGLLAGAAFAVKSLLVAPALVTVGLILLGRRRPRELGLAVLVAAGVLGVATAPWGVSRVYDESVRYHLDQAGDRHPVANARKTASTLGDRDLPLVAAGGLAAVAAIALRRRRRRPGEVPASSGLARFGSGAVPIVVWPIVVWLVLVVLVLVAESPLWRNHLAHLVPPAALLVGVYRPPWPTLVVAGLVLLPYHLVHLDPMLRPGPYEGVTATLERDLRRLPADAQVVSDDPGLVWRAGRRSPPDLVDTSILRIHATKPSLRITSKTVADAAARRGVCAVVVWSSRFGRFPDLPTRLAEAGYHDRVTFRGGRALYRGPCGAAARGPTGRGPGAVALARSPG